MSDFEKTRVFLGSVCLVTLHIFLWAEVKPVSPPAEAPPKKNANELAEYLESYRDGAQAGIAQDQYNLGASYRWGVGMPRNLILAAQWIRKAAEQGYPLAERTLGEIYEKGEGVAQNDAEALKWYKRAAGHGDQLAINAQAMIETKLRPLEKNPEPK